MPTLAVDTWALQEEEEEGTEERGETKIKRECIRSISKLGSESTESLAAHFRSQNWSGGCPSTAGSSQDGSLFCPAGTNHSCSRRSASL